MTKETLQSKTELEPLALGLAETFIQRWDLYARQLKDGRYICVRQPFETTLLINHLKGEMTLGTYVLNRTSQARYIVFDADDDAQMDRLAGMASSLADQAVPSYLESSRRGGHLWIFFAKAISGKDARFFGQRLSKIHNLLGVELFPKQSRLAEGPGSLVRLPFGIHRKTGECYKFITPSRQPLSPSLPDQIHILCGPETVPDDFLRSILTQPSTSKDAKVSEGLGTPKKPLSERIKDSISVQDFIGQYVELSPAGRGLCPFHDDQHNSFSVNTEKNYWHCFAGCGGGSIIDFWMKKQGCDFTQAVHELAEMVLQPHQTEKESGG